MLLKLAQIDPNEICLVRERIYAHKQRLANAQNEQAAVAAAASATAAATTGSVLGLYNNSSSLTSQSFANEKNKKTMMATMNINENKKKQAKINDILEESELFNTANTMDATSQKHHNRRGVLVDDMMTIRFPGDVKVLESCLSDVLYKDVWLNMAELLVENGFFQVARDYLFECLNASQVTQQQQKDTNYYQLNFYHLFFI